MYGDDLRIQDFAEYLEEFKIRMFQVEAERDLLDLVNEMVAAGVALLNEVCSIEKRTVN